MFQTIHVFDTDLNVEQDRTPQSDDIDLSDICLIPELAITCGAAMHGTLWPSSVTLAMYMEFCQRQHRQHRDSESTTHSNTTIDDGGADDVVKVTPVGATPLDQTDRMDASWWRRDGKCRVLCASDRGLSIDFGGARVLELGAGTGVCGLVCRRFTDAAHVTVTDIAAALPLIERNRISLGVEQSAALTIAELFWGQFGQRFAAEHVDILMASDVIYETKSHEPLLATFTHFWRLNPALIIVLAHRRRYAHEDQFFTSLAAAGFKKRDILPNVLSSKQRARYDLDGEYYLYQIWREDL